MKNHLQQLLKEYSEHRIGLKDQIELSEQLADPKNHLAEEIVRTDWQKQLEAEPKSVRNLNPVLDKIHHRIRLNENNKILHPGWWPTFQRIAAILIFPILFSFLAYFLMQNEKTVDNLSYAEIQCPLGVRTKFQLPDGSTGYLNSGSHLKYPVQFNGERQVELIGEAFFDIVHNEEAPFHVNTPNLNIKVLGTTFNVIANKNEATEEIILETGKVDVYCHSGKQLAVMKPNERLTLDIEKRTFLKDEVEVMQYTSWKDGKLVFRNENMQQVARRLSRWYNAQVLVDDHLLEDYTFHATFIDEPLDEVLRLLSITTPLSYKEENRESDKAGTFQQRKIVLKFNQSKINQFKKK